MVDPTPKFHAAALRTLLALVLTLALLGVAGCPLPRHVPPPKSAPAATVKFRLGHHYKPRSSFFTPTARPGHGQTVAPVISNRLRLRSLLAIDERELEYSPTAGVVSTWTRVKPGWRQYRIRSHYIEAYYVMVSESYTETKHTMCNKNVCDHTSGKYKCSYKYVSCTKQEQKYRDVRRIRHRNVANCSTLRQIHMRQGVTYLLSYRYVGPGSCSLTCHIQQFKSTGGFSLSPCPNVNTPSAR